MKTYRVVLTRVYVVAQQYDVLAATVGQAEDKALDAVRDKRPDVRAEAEDKGWQAPACAGIREIGAVIGSKAITLPMRPLDEHPDVFERGE